MRRSSIIGVILVVSACGGHQSSDRSPRPSTKMEFSATASSCQEIAARYGEAMQAAVECNPSESSPCGAQRPVAMSSKNADGSTTTGLCHIANAGYVSPDRVASVDGILSDYRAAGCEVAECPGPAPHTATCVQSGDSQPVCE
jgi:hypothetical protein